MPEKYKKPILIAAIILGLAALLYLGGVMAQVFTNYTVWMDSGGLTGQQVMEPVQFNPGTCFAQAFTPNGLKGMLLLLAAGAAISGGSPLSSEKRKQRL